MMKLKLKCNDILEQLGERAKKLFKVVRDLQKPELFFSVLQKHLTYYCLVKLCKLLFY